jgi:adenine-specific DNA-methyltransferase
MPSLHWIGKEKVINHHLEVPYRVLNHVYTFNEQKDSGNKIIHGDNLEALKSLLPEYEGKIKCIYIDPPYNTGNEGWVYNDNVNDPKIKKWLGQVVGKEAEDLTRHDKWLCMMYPRLKLLHKLLAEDGAIFISIDDNEQANLKLMMDEIFGGGNFIANIIWQKAFSPVNLRKTFSSNHDFVVVFCKNQMNFSMNGLQRREDDLKRYKNPDNDSRGNWTSSDLTVGPVVNEKLYKIIAPSGKEFYPPNGRCWVLTEERYNEYLRDNRIWFGEKGDNMPRQKKFLSEVKAEITPMTVWLHEEVGNNQDSKKEVKEIFPDSKLPFETPKPQMLLERVLELGTTKNSIILDSFAGSGTTAHAVLNLNKQDGGNRKFILIEMEEYAQTITAERVKRVIDGYADKEGTGGSFDYYELGQALFNEDNEINELVGVEKLRQYIYYTETKLNIEKHNYKDNEYLLNKHNDTAYYFFYEQDLVTTLNYEFLSTIKTKAEQYIIYADNCLLTKEFMMKHKIIFKKIPRDITKF